MVFNFVFCTQEPLDWPRDGQCLRRLAPNHPALSSEVPAGRAKCPPDGGHFNGSLNCLVAIQAAFSVR